MSKPTVVLDFDGVIHSFRQGYLGETVIPDPPVPGIKEVIDEIRKDYEVVVVSTRCSSSEGLAAVCEYLVKSGIEVDKVQKDKPPAVCYVDDRAICFCGETEGLVERIRKFQSWTQTGPDCGRLQPLTPEEKEKLLSGVWPGQIEVRGRPADINSVLQSIKEGFPHQNFEDIQSSECYYAMGGVNVRVKIIPGEARTDP